MNKRTNKNTSDADFFSADGVQLFQSGRKYFSELIILIQSAKIEIHLQTYIFETDETGMQVANALLASAKCGVKIFLLLDSFGSTNFSKSVFDEMTNAGIEIKWYGRFFRSGRFHIGRRLHRKIIVVDGHTSVVGGINISDNYNDVGNKKAWLDFAVVAGGGTAVKLRNICLQRWMKKPLRALPKELKNVFHEENKSSNTIIRVRQNDWVRRKNEVANSYRKMMRNSGKSIVIVGGYFLPGGRVRRILSKASARGVEIKIIVPAESDVMLMRNATLYLYQWLLRNKIRVFEYRPSNVHGKILITDKRFVSIGSYDLNNLSTYSNIELNLDIHGDEFATAFHQLIEKIIADDCTEVKQEVLSGRETTFNRFVQWFSYRMVKTVFVLAVWLANRKENEEYQ